MSPSVRGNITEGLRDSNCRDCVLLKGPIIVILREARTSTVDGKYEDTGLNTRPFTRSAGNADGGQRPYEAHSMNCGGLSLEAADHNGQGMTSGRLLFGSVRDSSGMLFYSVSLGQFVGRKVGTRLRHFSSSGRGNSKQTRGRKASALPLGFSSPDALEIPLFSW